MLGPTREAFKEVDGPVDELASDIVSAMEGLNDLKRLQLKVNEIQPFYDKACLIPADAPVPGRAGLEKKHVEAKLAATPAEAFYLLDLVRDRCIDVIEAHEKGAKKDDNGKSYWDEKKKALARLKAETDALNQVRKTLGHAQAKLVGDYIKEAELYIARDEIVGFTRAVVLLERGEGRAGAPADRSVGRLPPRPARRRPGPLRRHPRRPRPPDDARPDQDPRPRPTATRRPTSRPWPSSARPAPGPSRSFIPSGTSPSGPRRNWPSSRAG